jgi:hypothetical protein
MAVAIKGSGLDIRKALSRKVVQLYRRMVSTLPPAASVAVLHALGERSVRTGLCLASVMFLSEWRCVAVSGGHPHQDDVHYRRNAGGDQAHGTAAIQEAQGRGGSSYYRYVANEGGDGT